MSPRTTEPDDGVGGPPLPGRWLAAAIAAVSAPILVSLARALRAQWLPVSDLSYLEARVRDVGGPHTPLTGAYSRLGFDHPGPFETWLLAPLYRLSGEDPRALLVTAGLVNLCAIAAVLWVANRRGGRALVALAALVLLLLQGSLAAAQSDLVDPWNPAVAVLPFVATLWLGWYVATGGLGAAWAYVAAASWVMQAHAGYLPVAGALTLAVALVVVVGVRRGWLAWRWSPVVVAVVVGAALWAPPLIDQVSGDGNLVALLEANREAEEAPVGPSTAAGVLAAQLRPLGPWAGAPEDLDSLTRSVTPQSPIWLVAPAVALALVVVVGLRRRARGGDGRELLVLGVLLAATSAAALVAIARITGPPWPYLLYWSWGLAASIYLAAAWAGWCALAPAERWSPATASRVTAVAAMVAAAALGASTVAAVAAAATSDLPNDPYASAWAGIADEVADGLADAVDDDATVGVVALGTEVISIGHAPLVELERRGVAVCDPTEGEPGVDPLGAHRRCEPGEATHTLLVATDAVSARDLRADPAVEVLASTSTLTDEEEAELAELDSRIPIEDVIWALAIRRDGSPPGEPYPGAAYTAADMARTLELRDRAVVLAVGVREG